MMKNLRFLIIILLLFLSKAAMAQEIIDTPIEYFVVAPKAIKPKTYVLVTGRILGVNLEDVKGAIITNLCTAEKASSDSHGVYHIRAAKGDSIGFEFPKYSKNIAAVKAPDDPLNIVMIKKTADNLPAVHSPSDLRKAKNADDELYRILQKDAKLEDKWKY
ncbi:MAG: hypothetical protein ACHQIM_05905 [Sphingobacteriales bacterium]